MGAMPRLPFRQDTLDTVMPLALTEPQTKVGCGNPYLIKPL